MIPRTLVTAAAGAVLATLALIPAHADPDRVTRAAMLANSCAGCHGPGGESPGAIPSIAGKSADFIERALKEFRAGKRPATVMNRHATGYTDKEIALIASYFAEQ